MQDDPTEAYLSLGRQIRQMEEENAAPFIA